MSFGLRRKDRRPGCPKGVKKARRQVHVVPTPAVLSNDEIAALALKGQAASRVVVIATSSSGGPLHGNVHGQPEPGRRGWTIYPSPNKNQ